MNEAKARHNASQTHEKYLALGRDALQNGDRVAAENYFQHADHYYRIVVDKNERRQQKNAEAAPQAVSEEQRPASEESDGDKNESAAEPESEADLTEESATSGSA
ncbi:MAG: DUF4167 domain-containing protein [Alphaproteobacteria bacterium]